MNADFIERQTRTEVVESVRDLPARAQFLSNDLNAITTPHLYDLRFQYSATTVSPNFCLTTGLLLRLNSKLTSGNKPHH
jgi:hypothetical protein